MSIRQTETSSITWIHLKSFAVLLAFSKDKDKKKKNPPPKTGLECKLKAASRKERAGPLWSIDHLQ